MASKREDQEGDIVEFTPTKRKVSVQEGGNTGALLSVISFN
jgi:hypothetical protein